MNVFTIFEMLTVTKIQALLKQINFNEKCKYQRFKGMDNLSTCEGKIWIQKTEKKDWKDS